MWGLRLADFEISGLLLTGLTTLIGDITVYLPFLIWGNAGFISSTVVFFGLRRFRGSWVSGFCDAYNHPLQTPKIIPKLNPNMKPKAPEP